MSDSEYLALLKEADETIRGLADYCETTADLLKLIELKIKIAEILHNMNPCK